MPTPSNGKFPRVTEWSVVRSHPSEFMKNIPLWQRHLVVWPIILLIISPIGYIFTGYWWAAAALVFGLAGAVGAVFGGLFLFHLVLWAFGMEDEGKDCSY